MFSLLIEILIRLFLMLLFLFTGVTSALEDSTSSLLSPDDANSGATQTIIGEPEIVGFSTDVDHVNRAELLAGTARVPVRWSVTNRPESVNLVFEQIMPDGHAVNVELPRERPWVNSTGGGVVAPVYPGDAIGEIHLQLRLYSVSRQATVSTRPLILPILDTVPTVRINSFSVTPLNVIEGEPIIVSWDVSGVESVQIGLIYYGMPRHGEPMVYGSAGIVTLTAPEGVQGFEVILSDFFNQYQERVISQTIHLEVICRFEWFHEHGDAFTDNEFCPEAMRTVSGQYQAFEGGYMVTWQYNPYVWLYLHNSGFHSRPLTYNGMLSADEAQAILAVPPPDGLFSPGDAFRNVWSAPWERENLGWALAPQQNYTMTLQPSVHGATVFTLPDNAVVSVWQRLP